MKTMCELFGVSSAQEVEVNGLLREFFSHCDRHPNGWGLATFQGQRVSVEKEPVKASRSVYLKERLRSRIQASVLLAHIRYATIGGMDYHNSHPFSMQDDRGRMWTLIHNGTIFSYPPLAPYQYIQEGRTDSERILLYLIDCINQRQNVLGRSMEAFERFDLLDTIIRDMAKGNKLNLLLYDGELMYAHTNYANSLHVRKEGDTALFSTTPLGKVEWEPLPFTTLCAYHKGKRVYEGRPHGQEYIDNPEDLKYIFLSYAEL